MQQLRKIFRFIFSAWLILNVGIATIPRCENIIEVFQHALPQMQVSHHCDQAKMSRDIPQWTAARSCQCNLLKFMSVQMPQVVTEPELSQPPHVLHDITFIYRLRASHIPQLPWVPPPRVSYS